MRKLSSLLAIAGLALTATPVLAQEGDSPRATTKGAYVTAGVGGSWASSPSTTYRESGAVTLSGTRYNYNLLETGTQNLGGGVAAEAGIGYDFGTNIRAEVTYVLNTFAVGSTSVNGNAAYSGGGSSGNYSYSATGVASGNINTNSVFVSGYYDFKSKTSKSKFTPYVGAGLGWTSVNIPSMPYSATLTFQGNNFNYNGNTASGSAGTIGYLAKVGVSYSLAKPADLFVEGIYQGNTSATINFVEYGALNSFSARAGVRLRFGS